MAKRRRRGTAVIDTPKGILVVRVGRFDGFIMPGGGARKGETTEDAMIRELKEETNLTVKRSTHLFDCVGGTHKDRYGRLEKNYHEVFLVEPEGKAKPRNEIAEVAYYRPESGIIIGKTTKKIIARYNKMKNNPNQT